METVTIELSKGKIALIDAADLPLVSGMAWHAVESNGEFYAAHTQRITPKRCKRIYMHRLLMGNPEGALVDHRDRNTLNNTRENLRVTDKSGNAANSKNRKRMYSQFRGVTFSKRDKKWIAMVTIDNKLRSLGSYRTEEEAARAYNAAALEAFGEFATLNEIPGLTYEESITPPHRNRLLGRANKPNSGARA